jgi:hypothetical protein
VIRLKYNDGGSVEVGMTLDGVSVDAVGGLVLNDLGLDVLGHCKTGEMDEPDGMKEVGQDINVHSHFRYHSLKQFLEDEWNE